MPAIHAHIIDRIVVCKVVVPQPLDIDSLERFHFFKELNQGERGHHDRPAIKCKALLLVGHLTLVVPNKFIEINSNGAYAEFVQHHKNIDDPNFHLILCCLFFRQSFQENLVDLVFPQN